MAATRVDFVKVLEDIAYLGLEGVPLASRLRITPGELQGLAKGREPRRHIAEDLAALWSSLTGKPLQFLPGTDAPFERPRAVQPKPDEVPPGPSFAELQGAMERWARKGRRATPTPSGAPVK